MTEIINISSFYAPWPHFGKKLNHQWSEIRKNQETLAPLARGLVVDADPNLIKDGSLVGVEFGEPSFHNKFRLIWSKVDSEFQFQCNEGTETVPIWNTSFYVDCGSDQIVFDKKVIFAKDAHIEGEFTGLYLGIRPRIEIKDTSGAKIFDTPSLIFDRQNFYLTPDSNGFPTVNLINAGSGGGGVSSVTVTDGDNSVTSSSGIINVNKQHFYISTDLDGDPVINLLTEKIKFVQTGDFTDPIESNTLKFNREDFYLTKDSEEIPVVNLSRTPLINVSSTNIDEGQFATDTLNFNRKSFYLSSDSHGHPIVNFRRVKEERGITVLFPGRHESITWFVTSHDITVKTAYVTLKTSDDGFYPSVTWSIRYNDRRWTTGTELIEGGHLSSFYPGEGQETITQFDNPIIGANNFVWLDINDLGEGGGKEEELHITLAFEQEENGNVS